MTEQTDLRMPAAIVWAVFFTPGAICILADIVRLQITGLAALGVVFLVIWAWALGAFTAEFWGPRTPRAVSPAFERAQQLSTLDRRDGVGGRS